jgi:small-conductance mechanosensitive channel
VNFQLSVRSNINHRILQRFEEEGLELPLSAATQAQLALSGDGSEDA